VMDADVDAMWCV